MSNRSVEKLEAATPCLVAERAAELRRIFPEVFTEGRVDFERLREALGDLVETGSERYLFSWAGRRDSIKLLQTPSRATLKPRPDEGIAFDETQHVFIEGENLETLKLLYKSYFGRVKMIYIDPPYNTGNDFVYRDDYAAPLDEYLRATGQRDANGDLVTSKLETSGRFHSNWLSMIYPRLFLARQLLRDDGVIFVSIDDNEVHNLRMVMNEIFGEENFIDTIIWKKRYGGGAKEKYLVSLHEYIVLYAKNKEALETIFVPNDEESITRYYKYKDEKFEVRGSYRTHPLEATKSMGERKNLVYAIPAPDGTDILPKRQWLWSKERTLKALENNEIEFIQTESGWTVHTKQYLRDENGKIRQKKAFSIIDNVYTQHGTNEIIDVFGDIQFFPFPKPTGLIKTLIQIGTNLDDDEDNLVLDFFAGSCTTAQAVLELNREDGGRRRFICVQLPEPVPKNSPARRAKFNSIADIGKERIRRCIARMKAEREARLPDDREEDLGFRVFHLAPSNLRQWQPLPPTTSADEYAAQLELMIDPLIEGWRAEDVIWEAALKEGYALSSRIEQVEKGEIENRVSRVTDADRGQSFWICLDDRINQNLPAALGLKRESVFICRDAALDDTLAANLALQCRLKTI